MPEGLDACYCATVSSSMFPVSVSLPTMRAFLERQRYLIDYTLAALLRRKTRNLGLLLIYTLLVFLFSSVLLLSQGLRREAATLLQDAPEVIVQRVTAGRHDLLPAAWLDRLRQIRGVSAVQHP